MLFPNMSERKFILIILLFIGIQGKQVLVFILWLQAEINILIHITTYEQFYFDRAIS